MGPGSGSRFATRSTSTCSPGPDGEANEATIVNNLYARSVSFVKDAERSLRFYTETLGFSLDWKYEEQGRVRTDPESDWATDRRSGGSRPRVYWTRGRPGWQISWAYQGEGDQDRGRPVGPPNAG